MKFHYRQSRVGLIKQKEHSVNSNMSQMNSFNRFRNRGKGDEGEGEFNYDILKELL
jgi:hypothetical protein